LEADLLQFGVRPEIALALEEALQRPRGLVVFTGCTGQGKTTLAQIAISRVRRHSMPCFVGDVRSNEDVQSAVDRATRGLVVAVARSGESVALRTRFLSMGLTEEQFKAASIVVVTQRFIRHNNSGILVIEVLNADEQLVTRSIADEARGLVDRQLITEEEARYNVPNYSQLY